MVKKRGGGARKKSSRGGGPSPPQSWNSTLASLGSGNMKRPRRPTEATVSYFLGVTSLLEGKEHHDGDASGAVHDEGVCLAHARPPSTS